MSKELPFFKFFPSDWMMGIISTKSYHIQGVFIRLCCVYWQNNCDLKKEKAFKFIDEKEIKVLESCGVVKIQKSKIVIKFLKEQNKELAERHAALSAAGRRGGKATLKPPLSDDKATPKHKDKDKDIEEEVDKDVDKEKKKNSKKGETSSPYFNDCKLIFLEEYKKLGGGEYIWSAKEATNLKSLISKIQKKIDEAGGSAEMLTSFEAVLARALADKWIKNHFSISLINSKFNEIIISSNGKSTQQIKSEIDRIVERRSM